MALEIKNEVLSVSGQLVGLPSIDQDAVVRVWEVPIDYRDNGLFVATILPGQPDEIPACDLAEAQYLGEVIYLAEMSSVLGAAKRSRLVFINEACDKALLALTNTYPACELQSWPQQVSEAGSLQLDPPGAAPLLTAIAEARGVPVTELADRVERKAMAYAEFSGVIIGKRQRLEDELNAAETLEAVGAISW